MTRLRCTVDGWHGVMRRCSGRLRWRCSERSRWHRSWRTRCTMACWLTTWRRSSVSGSCDRGSCSCRISMAPHEGHLTAPGAQQVHCVDTRVATTTAIDERAPPVASPAMQAATRFGKDVQLSDLKMNYEVAREAGSARSNEISKSAPGRRAGMGWCGTRWMGLQSVALRIVQATTCAQGQSTPGERRCWRIARLRCIACAQWVRAGPTDLRHCRFCGCFVFDSFRLGLQLTRMVIRHVAQEPCSCLSSRLRKSKHGGAAGSSETGRDLATVMLVGRCLLCSPGGGTLPACA